MSFLARRKPDTSAHMKRNVDHRESKKPECQNTTIDVIGMMLQPLMKNIKRRVVADLLGSGGGGGEGSKERTPTQP